MKKRLNELLERHRRDFAWFTVATAGWALAFWYMPEELRHALILQASNFCMGTIFFFLLGLVFKAFNMLHWLMIGAAFSLLFGEHTRAIVTDGSLVERLALLSALAGLSLASSCPPWSTIKRFFHKDPIY